MPKMTYFKAQQWAFSFSAEHGYLKEDVDFLLLGQLNWTLAQLLSNYQQEMPTAVWEKFQTNVKKMCQGYPPQYLLGSTSFYGLKLQVTPATLIPRPDTEELVDFILTDLQAKKNLRVADIGTGTGAIGLALKSNKPSWDVSLTDISEAALAVARNNAHTLGLDVELKQGDLLAPLVGRYDVIVSNPPYIPKREADLMDESVKRYEPALALFAAKDGLAIYERLAKEIRPYLKPKARLYLEIGFSQAKQVQTLFLQEFPQAQVTVKQDLTGHDRMIKVEF